MYEISRFNKRIQDNVKANFWGELISGGSSLLGNLLGGGGGEEGDARLQAITDLLNQTTSKVNPEMYNETLLNPQLYSQPDALTGQQVADSPEARAYQANSLKQMEQIQNEGLNSQQMADFAKARRESDIQARGQSEALQQQQQAKGTATSGVSAVLDQMGRQAAADRMSQSTTEQAAETARQRALANAQVFAAGGQLRGADTSLNKTNADIINEFNKLNSAKEQATKNANIDLQNQAIAAQRNTQNANVGLRNTAQQQSIQNQINKANAVAGAMGNQAKADYAGSAASAGKVGDIFNTLGATGAGIYNSVNTPTVSTNTGTTNASNNNDELSALNPKKQWFTA